MLFKLANVCLLLPLIHHHAFCCCDNETSYKLLRAGPREDRRLGTPLSLPFPMMEQCRRCHRCHHRVAVGHGLHGRWKRAPAHPLGFYALVGRARKIMIWAGRRHHREGLGKWTAGAETTRRSNNKVLVFEGLFLAGLRMLCHSFLLDVLEKFKD